MTISYRCSRCRGRNVFAVPVGLNTKVEVCRHCGYGNFYLDKERRRRKACVCDGGLLSQKNGSIPHREGSPCCIANPHHPYYRARRAGAPEDFLAELLVDLAWENEGGRCGPDDPIPF